MKPIRNATVYRISLPTLEALEDHLAEKPFQEPTASDILTAGFVPTPTLSEGELVTVVTGALVFCLRIDEKIVPGGVVLAEVQKRADAEEQELGYRIGRMRRREIKEAVLADLYARALIRTTYTPAFYHRDSQILIVPTASKRVASLLTGKLIDAVGSIESRTIHIAELKHGLTTRLGGYLDGDETTFWPFELQNSVWLEGPSGQKVAYQLTDDLSGARGGIQEAISAGCTVSAVQLNHTACTFRLTHAFHFKSISAGEPDDGSRSFDTELDKVRHEVSVQVLAFVAAIKDLMVTFGYKEEAPK